MRNVVMYSMDNCPFCIKAKELIDKFEGIKYTEYKFNVDFTKDTLIKKLDLLPNSRVTVPQIFIDDKHVGGYDDLLEYVDNVMGGLTDYGF